MAGALLEKDILLAEDDSDDVCIFELAMQEMKFPYSLRHAKNGDILFVLLKDKIPYILFLDINMPCKDGIACIIEIRKNREYDQLPVVMYTGHLAEKLINESYRNGANLYLTKTSMYNELVLKLNKIFSINWKEQLYYPPQSQFMLG